MMLSNSSVNGKIYVIGGASENAGAVIPLSSVEEYPPEGWSVYPQDKMSFIL